MDTEDGRDTFDSVDTGVGDAALDPRDRWSRKAGPFGQIVLDNRDRARPMMMFALRTPAPSRRVQNSNLAWWSSAASA